MKYTLILLLSIFFILNSYGQEKKLTLIEKEIIYLDRDIDNTISQLLYFKGEDIVYTKHCDWTRHKYRELDSVIYQIKQHSLYAKEYRVKQKEKTLVFQFYKDRYIKTYFSIQIFNECDISYPFLLYPYVIDLDNCIDTNKLIKNGDTFVFLADSLTNCQPFGFRTEVLKKISFTIKDGFLIKDSFFYDKTTIHREYIYDNSRLKSVLFTEIKDNKIFEKYVETYTINKLY